MTGSFRSMGTMGMSVPRPPGSPASGAAPGTLLGDLKARDNVTNWRHLAFVWVVIGVTLAAAIEAEGWIRGTGHSAWWILPLALATIVLIGASQHQLGGAIHEGTHYILFKNRRLNELASDWLAAFPIYTSTYQFRVHHLAHHQFVNDPERDPDIAQLKESGHWLDFPVAHVDLLRKLLRQLWLPNLVRYTLVRAKYSALGFDQNPYRDETAKPGVWPNRVGILFAAAVPGGAIALIAAGRPGAALGAIALSWCAAAIFYARLPEGAFLGTRLKPVVSQRATAIGRVTFMALMYAALTATEAATGAPAWGYFGLYWVVPLFSTFALFMVLRQWVQHGNADRGRLTNTRVFLVGPLVRYAVFPWGMDYHLPHHVYASVPHYRLKDLHQLLLADPEYREKGVIVEGYFGGSAPGAPPTAMSVLGPAFAPRTREAVHVDNAALEHAEVTGREIIAARAARSEAGER